MALTKVTNDLQDALAASQPTITSTGTLTGLTVTGEITANGGIALGDNDELTLGDSDEFKIKHHASGYTHLQNTVGTLYIDSDSVTFRDDDGSPSNMVISDSGVGIGGAPSHPLHITKEIAGYQAYFNNDNGSGQGVKVRVKANDSGNFNMLELVSASSGSDVTAMVVRDDGNVGIGVSAPTRSLVLGKGDSTGVQTQYTNSTTGAALGDGFTVGIDGSENAEFWNFENTNMLFATNGTERMRIDSAGNVGIGLDGGYKLDVLNTIANVVSARFTTTAAAAQSYGPIIVLTNDPNDTTRYLLAGGSPSVNRFVIYSNGNIKNQNNSYTGISDEKLKENIVDAGSQWDDIKALRVRKYSFKEEKASEPTQIGVIAQEVEAVGMSGLVYETADQETAEDGSFVDTGEVTKTMKYSILYMKAVKALQEAMIRIETLERRLTALEGE